MLLASATSGGCGLEHFWFHLTHFSPCRAGQVDFNADLQPGDSFKLASGLENRPGSRSLWKISVLPSGVAARRFSQRANTCVW